VLKLNNVGKAFSTEQNCFRRWVTALLILAATSLFGSVASGQAADPTQARVTASMQELKNFQSTHAFSSLRDATTGLYTSVDMSSIARANYVARRRAIVQAWAQIFRTIEQSYDPKFDPSDPNDLPESCVTPPDGFACGVAPQVIKNPQVRSEYAADVRANELKSKRAIYYQQLHNIDEGAMVSMRMNLESFATAGAPSDFAALDKILRAAGLSNKRMIRLDAMLNNPASLEAP
jgi:hypothetical protein